MADLSTTYELWDELTEALHGTDNEYRYGLSTDGLRRPCLVDFETNTEIKGNEAVQEAITKIIAKADLQDFLSTFGFGISVEELAERAYRKLDTQRHKVCIVNSRYLEVDGTTFLLSKSKKHGGWIAKEI
ncbi:MAG: hypothetical protein K5768_08670 [Firmicutes bacterium]|nr:hypothetical protein [Bacillota bacterium]